MKRKFWTRELVEKSFRDFDRKHGRPPKHDELGTHGLPHTGSVERLYGTNSFTKACAAAGLTPRGVGRPRLRSGVRVAA
jgi:hypothetical protein